MKNLHEGFKIFVDFDGTVTTEDVGDAIFRNFGDKPKVDKIIEALLSDRLPAKDSWIALCSSIGAIKKDELDQYISTFTIDEGFNDFVKFCKESRHDLFILSDGFDYYIEKIFCKEGIEGINIYSNRLTIDHENKLIPSFPYFDSEFLTSANCKRNHIINNSSDDDYTFYIGDGNSDKYAAQYCDFIFAKNDLLKFCEKERITYFPFQNFFDVTERIKELSAKKRLRKRHRAVLKRKKAYMAE
jgi:2,3-diketo-5-methylthio-1-phosphopentane phosphatase